MLEGKWLAFASFPRIAKRQREVLLQTVNYTKLERRFYSRDSKRLTPQNVFELCICQCFDQSDNALEVGKLTGGGHCQVNRAGAIEKEHQASSRSI